MTFSRMKRAMQTSDMLHDVGPSFDAVFAEGEGSELRWPGPVGRRMSKGAL